ncbi:ABC transporter ATP-binding protein [Persicobacter sp. CCB-QB2]|uniref:ABC transporter ATP-binding protein n=1 Tax=Persicobacter sp. CCB-QB2 TaxID=1561025 RepID=UPI0006A968E4|nr:ABC transporter ATP-binding protein [Persicobacter sp. CCB-QB2]
MKDLQYLNRYLLKYKYYLILGLLFIAISNFFVIIPGQLVRNALDLVMDNISLYRMMEGLPEMAEDFGDVINSSVIVYGVSILVMALLRGFFLFMVRQTIIAMSRHIEFDLKNEIYAHYQSLPTSFYRRNNTGDLMARISEDVSKVRMYLGPAIMYGLNMVVLFLMLIPYMFSINAKLTLYALLPLPVLSLSIYFVNNIINRRSEEIQRSLSDLSTFVQEAFSGIRVIKSFSREEDSSKNLREQSKIYRDRSLGLTRVQSLFFPLILSLIGLSTILTIFVGGSEVLKGQLSFGNIAEFVLYVQLLTWPVTSLGWITSIIQRAAASQKRINEFLFTKNNITSEKEITPEVTGSIKFDNVSFTYEDSGIQALQNVDFEIAAGESVAIIGGTGCGKSTLANLICRLFDVTEGAIQVDGHDVRDFKIDYLRGQIGYVPQDVFLFSDSIRNNIAFGSNDVTEEEMLAASRQADLHENISRFENGYETVLGERGITLSGGQKQRVSIARAIVRNPKVLILDDSLSAVDTKTENAILNALKEVMANKTSIIISHRISSAKLADKILVLNDGQIEQQGTHEELLEKGGAYKELYLKQLQGEEMA